MARRLQARGDHVLTCLSHSAVEQTLPSARVRESLRRAGLCAAEIQHVLCGAMISDGLRSNNRPVLAWILTAFAKIPPGVLEICDWPGEYAQRLDGIDHLQRTGIRDPACGFARTLRNGIRRPGLSYRRRALHLPPAAASTASTSSPPTCSSGEKHER